MPWWVLNVFVDMIENEKFTESKIFTAFSDREYLETSKWKIEIVTALPTFLNNLFLFFANKHIFILSSVFDYRNLMFFYKLLMKILSTKIIAYTPPKIVISSFAISKNLEFCKNNYKSSKLFKKHNFDPITSLYLHSPMQYIRSHHQEYLQKIKWYKLKIFKYITPKLQQRDKNYTVYDQVYSNSEYTAELAQKIYNLESTVKYPQIQQEFLHQVVNPEPQNYYIYVWRLVRFVKELDKIIWLFNQTWKSLLIMWSGPDEQYLKSISNWNIIFIWRIEDTTEKIKIIKNALWLINITKESFGLWTVEALLLWVPVFGYNDWASPELIDQSSGLLIPDKRYKTLLEYFDKFEKTKRDRKLIQDNINLKLKKSHDNKS